MSGSLAVRFPLLALTPPLRRYVVTVTTAGAAAVAVGGLLTHWRGRDAALFGLLLVFGVVTVEVVRRVGEPAGAIKEVHGVWELPVALLLPPVYALVMPVIWIALTQWRVRRTLLHRRLFSSAAIGLSYGAASLAFHVVWRHALHIPSGPAAVLPWMGLAAAAGVLRCVLNYALVLTALRLSDPTVRIRDVVGEHLSNESAELCLGILAAYCTMVSPFLLALMLPCGLLLARSARHAQLLHASRTDPKTGLLTATAWQTEAEVQAARAARSGTPLAVAMIDIDHFKGVNDSYGHLAGDGVLASVAATLAASLREGDLAARFGGEEFCLLLPGVPPDEAVSIADRLRARLGLITVPVDDPVTGPPPRITVSIGVAALAEGISDPTDLLAAADAALYQAKQAGRNAVRLAGGWPAGLARPVDMAE